jgi:serine/threonine protein kinase
MQHHALAGYSTVRTIFMGGMTDLYVATDAKGQRVVLRYLKAVYARNRDLRKRFLHGAEVLSKLQNPDIVRLLDYGTQDKIPYMVLEFVPSVTLRELIARRHSSITERPVPFLRQLAAVLHFIHLKGYMHLDFKPENLLVRPDGQVVLIDFDLCTKRRRRPVKVYNLPGTFSYVAPEVLTRQRADERADIFSFGVVAYEVVNGRKPFERNSLDEMRAAHLNPDIVPLPFQQDTAPMLREVILKSLAKDPDNRYPDMSLVLKSLDILR